MKGQTTTAETEGNQKKKKAGHSGPQENPKTDKGGGWRFGGRKQKKGGGNPQDSQVSTNQTLGNGVQINQKSTISAGGTNKDKTL